MCSPNGFFGPGQKTKREVIDFLPSPFPPQCQIGANFINWRQRMSIFLRYPFVVMSQSSHSIWYLCSWEDQERENEQGNEKSILEQLQQTLLGKMVKFSWSLVSLMCLPATFSLSTRFFVLKLKRWAKSSWRSLMIKSKAQERLMDVPSMFSW